jgi:hypothetical protein
MLPFHRPQLAETVQKLLRYLLASAAPTGSLCDIPRGCVRVLSSVGSEGHFELRELVRLARAVTLNCLKARLGQAVADGEIPASVDVLALARFMQTVRMPLDRRDELNQCSKR